MPHRLELMRLFQHTAARRRLGFKHNAMFNKYTVSTHSRPKAAGGSGSGSGDGGSVSTHSRPKAAGAIQCQDRAKTYSFNTQPPEGGWNRAYRDCFGQTVSTHSRPKAAGGRCSTISSIGSFQHTAARRRLGVTGTLQHCPILLFQHTAARRRLVADNLEAVAKADVSTHSRPKAAGGLVVFNSVHFRSFNTQPPEGGWFNYDNDYSAS